MSYVASRGRRVRGLGWKEEVHVPPELGILAIARAHTDVHTSSVQRLRKNFLGLMLQR